MYHTDGVTDYKESVGTTWNIHTPLEKGMP